MKKTTEVSLETTLVGFAAPLKATYLAGASGPKIVVLHVPMTGNHLDNQRSERTQMTTAQIRLLAHALLDIANEADPPQRPFGAPF